jgi:hypothetical protein
MGSSREKAGLYRGFAVNKRIFAGCRLAKPEMAKPEP